MPNIDTDALLKLREVYQENQTGFLEEFFTFLKFPSISSDPAFSKDVLLCAEWLVSYIKSIGFSVELWEQKGHHPVIFAAWNGAGSDAPTLLIYNHYDVQPVDPLELWHSPPFEPVVREGVIYARGAQDNKGQCFYVLQALKILMAKNKTLPLNIKLCIEGEEECGSAGLMRLLPEKAQQLQADYLAVVDLGIKSATEPALTLGIRGVLTMEVEVTGSKMDLHSGSHGGIVYNPIHALVEILGQLRDPEGKIAIPGFYDGIEVHSAAEMEKLSMEFDAEQYENTFGAKATGGESALPPLERNWLRPTIEINGICGGYTGLGFKTVIPAKAFAKISCRLVPHQDPQEIGEKIARYLEQKAPPGVAVQVKLSKGHGPAVRTRSDSHLAQAFASAFEEVYAQKCHFIFEGASIPIAAALALASHSDPILLGVGLADDAIHAPNEHFSIDRLEKGCLMIARGIERLATLEKSE